MTSTIKGNDSKFVHMQGMDTIKPGPLSEQEKKDLEDCISIKVILTSLMINFQNVDKLWLKIAKTHFHHGFTALYSAVIDNLDRAEDQGIDLKLFEKLDINSS